MNCCSSWKGQSEHRTSMGTKGRTMRSSALCGSAANSCGSEERIAWLQEHLARFWAHSEENRGYLSPTDLSDGTKTAQYLFFRSWNCCRIELKHTWNVILKLQITLTWRLFDVWTLVCLRMSWKYFLPYYVEWKDFYILLTSLMYCSNREQHTT